MATRPKAIFDTGDVGEGYAQMWGAAAGFTVNPVRRDKKGWDFVFQSGVDPKAPLEVFAAEPRCWIQVKTTRGNSERSRVSLANWRRMVLDPEPWFILLVRVDLDGEVKGASLLHANQTRIEHVLKTLWRANVKTEAPLTRRHVDAIALPEEALRRPFARCLRERIRGEIGDSKSYAARKTTFVASVGIDERPYGVTVTIDGTMSNPAESELVADFAIGLVKKLPVSRFDVKERRFGVPRHRQTNDQEGMSMELPSGPPSIRKTTLIFRNKERTRSAAVSCDTYVARAMFPRLPDEFAKVRFVSPMMSVTAVPKAKSMKFVFRIPDEATIPLVDLAAIADVLPFVEREGFIVSYALGDVEGDLGFCDKPIELSAEVRELATAARNAAYLAARFHLPDSTPVELQAIHSELRSLVQARLLLDRGQGHLDLHAVVPREEAIEGKPIVFVLSIAVRIGEHALCTGAIYHGTATWIDGKERLGVKDGQVEVLGEWKTPAAKFDHAKMVERVHELAAAAIPEGKFAKVFLPRYDDAEE